MRSFWLFTALLVFSLGLSGCKSQVEPEGPVVDDKIKLNEETDVKLADWLGLPRAKLAEMADEVSDRLENAFKVNRSETDALLLLSQLRLPMTVPVLHQAKFSELGISLPPYWKAGQKDSDLALHLARYGDGEGALKLADPDDKQLLARIEACQTERNYPVEWTRLVALTLQEAELKMATGEVDGASDLVLMHRELRTLLDHKAATGPLGAALLPLGVRDLRQAVVAWRESNNQLPAVADQIEQALTDWGNPPGQQLILKPGASRAEVARLFKDGGTGQVLGAHSPLVLRRLLDLQDLPVVGEGVVGAVVFFDDKDRLAELWYVYRSRLGELFPDTTSLAHHLIEENARAGPIEKVDGLPQQTYTAGDLGYIITLTPRTLALGGIVRVGAANAKPAQARLPANPLDLGAVNLNRTYERTRYELAPETVWGKSLEFKQPEFLAQLKVPVGEAKPGQATLVKVKDVNLFDSLILNWPSEENMSLRAWPRLLLPLWAAFGPSRLVGQDRHLNLIWEQAPARVNLLLPFDDSESPDLVWRDTRPVKDQRVRLETAMTLDEQMRKTRLKENKPLVRLPRHLQWLALELGMTRDQASKELPREIRSRPLVKTADGSFCMLFTGALAGATATPQQLMLRFAPDDKLAEVRIRYQEVPAKPGSDTPPLLKQLEKTSGMPELLPAPWAGLWSDLPGSKVPPVYYRWLDDRTRLTYQGDSSCLEVILTDCPPDQPEGVTLPKLETCSRGVEGCHLGDSREDVVKRWKQASTSTTPDGGLVLFQAAKSPYDLCVVYFENGKVNRILGRYRIIPASANEDFTAALNKVWGADLDRLGVIRRIDRIIHAETGDPVVRGYSWNDDRTRIRTFIEQPREGHRMFIEWREWPIPVRKPTTTVRRGEV